MTLAMISVAIGIFAGIVYYLVQIIAAGRAATAALNIVVVPSPPGVPEALSIIGRTYEMDIRALKVVFVQCQCDDKGRPGYLTHKGNCTWGAVAPYSPQVNVAWRDGMTLSESGLAEGCYQYWEVATYGLPDVYHKTVRWISGISRGQIDQAMAALKAAGM